MGAYPGRSTSRGDKAIADRAYARSIGGGFERRRVHRTQDVIFIASRSRRGGLGCRSISTPATGVVGTSSRGANPLLLEPVLDDASLRKTKFVLLQAAPGPTERGRRAAQKPNVTDFSEQTWLPPTRELATSIRYWLEWHSKRCCSGPTCRREPFYRLGRETAGTTTSDARHWRSRDWNDERAARSSRARAAEIGHMVLRGTRCDYTAGPTNRITAPTASREAAARCHCR